MSHPQDLKDFYTLVNIFARLRAPDGCPWDRKQTHATLRENLLEESYEVLETIDEGEPGKLREELGDLLMQIVFHAQIAAEESRPIDDHRASAEYRKEMVKTLTRRAIQQAISG